jgi:purine catabolism regulator
MKLIDALQLPSLRQAHVTAGEKGLDRTIRWVHIVDLPDPLPWVQSGDFLLTTGYAWPRDEVKLREFIFKLSELGLAGVGLAVPQYWENMPAAARIAAEELQFPLIEIPWEVPFKSISEEILNSIITFHYKLQEQSEFIHQELIRIALDAQSLQDIALTLGRLIGKKVIIQHPEGQLLAQSGNEEENAQVPHDLLSLLEDPELLLSLRADSQGKRIPAMTESGLPERFVCPIYMKRELVGLLWIIEGTEPLTELDQRAAEYASIVMALHISQQRALSSLEAQLGYSFLDSLLEGQFSPTTQVLRRAGLLGFEPEGIYCVGIIIMDSPLPMSREAIVKRERLAERLKRRLQELKVPTLLSLMQNQILFLLPERFPAEHIWQTIEAPDLTFAISHPHRGFDNIQKGYQEVVSILPHLNFGQFHRYHDLLVPRVLMGDVEARTSFLGKLFDPLRSGKNGDMLIRTLLTFARLGFHLKNTANELNIHPKTLRYRLDRTISLGNFDLNDTETQFHLQLADRIVSLELKHP